MWKSDDDTDILDFALLWEPLGGPTSENIGTAFAIGFLEYDRRLCAAVQAQLTRLREGIISSECIYGLSVIAALDQVSRRFTVDCDIPALARIA